MKSATRLFLVVALVALTGCSMSSWPKDAYIQNASSAITLPWGSSIQKADVMATGTAARNISELQAKTAKPAQDSN